MLAKRSYFQFSQIDALFLAFFALLTGAQKVQI